jgi:CRP-like cAMP-binding protein
LRTFIDRLLVRSDLTEGEQLALLGLHTREAVIPAGRDLRRYGEQSDYAAIISAGVVGRYHQARDGRRNFVAMHLPGDMADLCTTVLKDVSFGLDGRTGFQGGLARPCPSPCGNIPGLLARLRF